MEKDSIRGNNNNSGNGNNSHHPSSRERGDGLLRSSSQATTSDFVLQWGNRKRLRCMKVQVKDDPLAPAHKTTARVDRRVVRADRDPNQTNGNGYLNLRQRPCSPPLPPPQRILRNSENSTAMRGQSNGGLRGFSSPDRGAHDKRGAHHHSNNNHHHHHANNHTNYHHNHSQNHNHNHYHHHHNNEGNKSAASSETAHDSKKGGSSSGSGEAAPPVVWPPKFVIALTNKEKEEDFIVFKGSKLPQRPKKRAKIVQRTVNLVCPGGWLCDLTLERYEVREKKISKKRPRGLKAMGNMESDSE